MMSDESMMIWPLILMKLGESKLEYYALLDSWKATVDPHSSFIQRTNTHGTVDKLLKKKSKPEPIEKESAATKKKGYCYHHEEGLGRVVKEYFHQNESCSHEMDHRQPGTNEDSDIEDAFALDFPGLGTFNSNDRFAPITTVAGQYLTSISFAAPDSNSSGGSGSGSGSSKRCDLYPSYQMQFSVRADDTRKYLYYDCFEYKPKWWQTDTDALPSQKEYRKAMEALGMGPDRFDCYDSEEESSDEEGDDDPVELKPHSDVEALKKTKLNVKLCAHAGGFMLSRLFRIQVPLSGLCGVRVHSPPLDDDDAVDEDDDSDEGLLKSMMAEDGEDDGDAQSVLILELEQPASTFAVRCVSSHLHGDNNFSVIDDWTPGQVASRATRHYICGKREEINAIAAHLAAISPSKEYLFKYEEGAMEEEKPPKGKKKRKELQDDETPCLSAANSLNDDDVYLTMGSAPAPRNAPSGATGKEEKTATNNKEGGKNLTEDDVHTMLKEKCGVEHVDSVSQCLKRALLVGHIKLTRGADTIVTTGKCFTCRKKVTCTVGDVLYQQDYGGCDYEEGGQEATLRCPGNKSKKKQEEDDEDEDEDEEDEDEDESQCDGIYVTRMCEGRPDFDTGKFHNHCTECPSFGVCIGDYREAHCDDCGGHWFRGGSGFPCAHCGGGSGRGRKGKSLAERKLPDESVWDGWVEGYTRADDERHIREMSEKIVEAIQSHQGNGNGGCGMQ